MHTGNRDIPCSSVFIRSFVRDVHVRQQPANADREPPAQVLRRYAAAAAHARRGAGVPAAARRGRRQGGRDGGALKVFMRPEPSELPGQRGPPHGRLRLRQLCVIPARGNGPVHAGYANSSIAFDDRPNGSYWPIADAQILWGLLRGLDSARPSKDGAERGKRAAPWTPVRFRPPPPTGPESARFRFLS